MATVAEVLNQAVQQHQAGNLHLAEQLYHKILQADPGHAEAHYLLGAAVQSRGKLEEARAHYQRALLFNPNYAEVHCNLGLVLHLQGELDQAEAHCRQALRLHPSFPEAHNNLGNTLLDQGKPEEAAECFQHALRHNITFAEAYNNLGNTLRTQGKLEEAVSYCRQALRLRPDFAEAHNNLGTALAELERPEEAVACLREAVRINPSFTEAWSNLGNALVLLDQLDEAVGCYQQALRLKPDYAKAHGNLGNTRVQQGRFDEAQSCYDQALRLDAGHKETHFHQSLLWLLLGKWAEGWPKYEWRWQTKSFPRYAFSQPRWDGSPLPPSGRTVLLLAEQGLGDTLQFVRYARLVQQRGCKVILQCQAPLLHLLAGVRGIDHVVAHSSPLPAFDAYARLLSLPAIFGKSIAEVPATVPYLQADADLVEHWRKSSMCDVRCATLEKPHLTSHIAHRTSNFLVGIAWQGNPIFRIGRQRSILLARFARLAEVEGVQLISLQKGPGTEQLSALAGQFPVLDLGTRLDEASGPFMDTAAVMKNLDLVISSDTAVPHLAGALGIPVWVALPIVPDWRWLLQREDSPWYPTMRLFRQTREGHWDDVFDRIAEELKAVVSCQKTKYWQPTTDN